MNRTHFAMGTTVPKRIREGRVLCGCGHEGRPRDPINWWPYDPETDTGGFWQGRCGVCDSHRVVHPSEPPAWSEP